MVRRLFIIWAHPLFHEAIRALLTHPEVQVVGAASQQTATQEQIRLLQPDTIILEESDEAPLTNTDILSLLDTSTSAIRVVRLSMEHNMLYVYHREQQIMQRADDLLHLIKEEGGPGAARPPLP